MLAVILAKLYSEQNPNNKIYANFTINLPNFNLTPYGFIPMSEFNDCLIILDDIASIMTTLKGFTKLIVNASRKGNVNVILTGQYYTQLDRYVRQLAITLIPNYDKERNILKVRESIRPLPERDEINDPNNYTDYYFKDPISVISGLYDTNEIVPLVDEKSMLEEILKWSKTKEDLRSNVALWKDSSSAQMQIFKKLEKAGYEV